MKNLKKYGCYTLLAVAVFIAFWLMGGFISLDYNVNRWEGISRFMLVILSLSISGMIISLNEIDKRYK